MSHGHLHWLPKHLYRMRSRILGSWPRLGKSSRRVTSFSPIVVTVVNKWIHSAQLDADHYGLEQIKRRLIEFLAVVRLHAMADEATLPPLISADEEPVHTASSGHSGPERSLVLVPNGGAVSRQDSAPIEPPKASSPKRKKGVKGPILL